MTARIADNLSGVRGAYPSLKPESGGGIGQTFVRVSGDALDGLYEATFEIPEFSEPETWELTIDVLDEALNSFGYTPSVLAGRVPSGLPPLRAGINRFYLQLYLLQKKR